MDRLQQDELQGLVAEPLPALAPGTSAPDFTLHTAPDKVSPCATSEASGWSPRFTWWQGERLQCKFGRNRPHAAQTLELGFDAVLPNSAVAQAREPVTMAHSLWELCRARTLNPRYIACGPMWPTLTKDMPWHAQGLDNLSWGCRMAGYPVVAIGGILGVEQVFDAARAGADGICVVRGIGDQPGSVVSALTAAMLDGRASAKDSGAKRAWPHPSLSPTYV